MYGLKHDWVLEPKARHLVLEDYEGGVPRWCPACGDHAVLGSLQRMIRDEQLEPEKVVVVSGIGCSSRFPHYMKTYGFHGLHGRALPVASGVRSRRPDLDVFVVTGDGDCCAIGTAHWIHAIRYNMKMVVLLFDNNIYGLTKMQSSPTTALGGTSNTHPRGTQLRPINPISVTLGIINASFVAQTVDWNPPHLEATLKAAYDHPGLAFVRILQRCPHYTPYVFEAYQKDPSKILLMTHDDGIVIEGPAANYFKNRVEHDPTDLAEARALAVCEDVHPIGLFYRDLAADRYDLSAQEGRGMTPTQKLEALDRAIGRFEV
jgi:2-oxoglutarate/2-oxoacid ferredoxin oxidoreductase subunit beta